MNMNRIWAILIRQYYLMRGSWARVIPLFAWVGIDIVLWGFIGKYMNTIANNGLNIGASILAAVLLWDFFMRVMQGVTIAFFEDVWSRNFLNFFATPLSISEYLSGLVFSSLLTSSVGLGAMLLLATQIFSISFFSIGAILGAYLLVLIIFGFALGILACAMVMRLGPASEWFVWPIPAFIVPFAGVYYPVTTLPSWMQMVSKALPPSYIFENLRLISSGGEATLHSLVISFGLAIGYFLVASFIFTQTYKYAIRSGLIARYSAETIS